MFLLLYIVHRRVYSQDDFDYGEYFYNSETSEIRSSQSFIDPQQLTTGNEEREELKKEMLLIYHFSSFYSSFFLFFPFFFLSSILITLVAIDELWNISKNPNEEWPKLIRRHLVESVASGNDHQWEFFLAEISLIPNPPRTSRDECAGWSIERNEKLWESQSTSVIVHSLRTFVCWTHEEIKFLFRSIQVIIDVRLRSRLDHEREAFHCKTKICEIMGRATGTISIKSNKIWPAVTVNGPRSSSLMLNSGLYEWISFILFFFPAKVKLTFTIYTMPKKKILKIITIEQRFYTLYAELFKHCL